MMIFYHSLFFLMIDETYWRNFVKTPYNNWPDDAKQSWGLYVNINKNKINHNFFYPFLSAKLPYVNWPIEAKNQFNLGILLNQKKSTGGLVGAVKGLGNVIVTSVKNSVDIKNLTSSKTGYGTKTAYKDVKEGLFASNQILAAADPLNSTLEKFNKKGIKAGGAGKFLGSMGEKARKNRIQATGIAIATMGTGLTVDVSSVTSGASSLFTTAKTVQKAVSKPQEKSNMNKQTPTIIVQEQPKGVVSQIFQEIENFLSQILGVK